jgi:peptide/nickel transport system substrate-binding protein
VFLAVLALGVGLVPRLSAFTGPDVREGLVSPDRPLSLDPLEGADTSAVHDVGHLLYRSLMRLDASGYPVPDLAASAAVDQSGQVYTLGLRRGLRWSNGAAITARDVLATIGFAQSKAASARTLAGLLAGVKAAAAPGAVLFRLPSPRASFLAALTQVPILPLGSLSPGQLAALPSQAAAALPTSGPYRVLSSDATALELIANPYAANRPLLGHFELRLYATFNDAAAAFARGDVDAVLATTPSQRARLLLQPQAVAHDVATFRFVDLLCNQRVQGLDDPTVRHAIAQTVDRGALISGALQASGGLPETGAISRGLPWAAGDAKEQPSVEAARVALTAAGWQPGADGVRVRAGVALRFSLQVADSDPLPQVANELAQQLETLGVQVSVRVVPAASFLAGAVMSTSFQLAVADWDAGPDPDVSAFWRSNATPPQGFNVSGAEADPFLDQALDMLATLPSRTGRAAAAAAVTQHLAEDTPAVFLYTPTVAYVMRGPLAGSAIPRIGAGEARFDQVAGWRRS